MIVPRSNTENWPQQAWLEINLDAITHNTYVLNKIVPNADLLAVVKANAAGLGVLPIATAAVSGGACAIGVFNVDEAEQLRQFGFSGRILIMGYFSPQDAARVIELNVAASVSLMDVLLALANAAADSSTQIDGHVKMDVGMYRAGAVESTAIALANAAKDMGSVRLEGFWTHFPSADEPDPEDTERRFRNFLAVASEIVVPIRHVANTATILRFPKMALEMVRPGAGVYGIAPGVTGPIGVHDLRSVFSWKARIVQLHDVSKGESVSYGGTWTADRDSRIAVVAVGYSDGFRRSLSNRGSMLVGGFRAPVVGTVCMDMCLLDMTDGPVVKIGDSAIIIGVSGEAEITLASFADSIGTIPYEVCTSLGPRMPRIYLRNGKPEMIQTVLDSAPMFYQ